MQENTYLFMKIITCIPDFLPKHVKYFLLLLVLSPPIFPLSVPFVFSCSRPLSSSNTKVYAIVNKVWWSRSSSKLQNQIYLRTLILVRPPGGGFHITPWVIFLSFSSYVSPCTIGIPPPCLLNYVLLVHIPTCLPHFFLFICIKIQGLPLCEMGQ